MAIKYMTTVDPYGIKKDDVGYEYDTGDIAAGNEGDTIIVPDNVRNIVVTLEITGGGSGKVQATTNKLADVVSDTDVVWVDWDAGVVSATTQDVAVPVTAIRAYRSSGTVRLMVRAQ